MHTHTHRHIPHHITRMNTVIQWAECARWIQITFTLRYVEWSSVHSSSNSGSKVHDWTMINMIEWIRSSFIRRREREREREREAEGERENQIFSPHQWYHACSESQSKIDHLSSRQRASQVSRLFTLIISQQWKRARRGNLFINEEKCLIFSFAHFLASLLQVDWVKLTESFTLNRCREGTPAPAGLFFFPLLVECSLHSVQ